MIKLAFYKGKGDFFDKLIRIWTNSPYSHVEIIINGIWYSASPRDGRVRAKKIDPNPSHWDFIEIPSKNAENMVKFIESQLGKKYDWLGILLSQIIPLGEENPNRWFCSEICSAAVKKGGKKLKNHPQWYSPARLFEELVWH